MKWCWAIYNKTSFRVLLGTLSILSEWAKMLFTYNTKPVHPTLFTRSVRSSSMHRLVVFTTTFELFLLPMSFAFLGGSFAAHWVVHCRHWGPATLFCCHRGKLRVSVNDCIFIFLFVYSYRSTWSVSIIWSVWVIRINLIRKTFFNSNKQIKNRYLCFENVFK